MVVTFEVVHEWMAQANVAILIGAAVLIIVSLFLERKKKWVWHGNSMMVVMIITALLVLAHMGPSFVEAVLEAVNSLDIVAVVGVIHGVIGVFALILGAGLVWVWSINESSSTGYCFSRKNLMLKILALWLVSLGFGGLYYLLHITFG